MSFSYNETITNFFHRASSKETPKRIQKRKRPQEQTGATQSLGSSDKKPKVQQKLVFSDIGPNRNVNKSGPSRRLAKPSGLKRGESSKSLGDSPAATSLPVDALSRVFSKETPTTRHVNPLPTPLTAKRPALIQATRSFLIPRTDEPTRTPRPQSPHSSTDSLHFNPRKTFDLPTPVTIPRRATYSRAQKSPQNRVRSLSPSKEFSSPEASQASSRYPLSSEYDESMVVEESQRDDYYSRDESLSPPPSQKLVPSSQSQADGCFDAISLFPEKTELSTSRHSPVFLVPRPPDKANRGQTLSSQEKQPSPVPHLPSIDTKETSFVEIHDGEEYVLSSQSQLMLPFHVSPRKNRRKASYSSSSSIPEDTTHFEEIIPSSQSQLEKELDVMSEFTDDRPLYLPTSPVRSPRVLSTRRLSSPSPTLTPPHALSAIDNIPLTAESSQAHMALKPIPPFSASEEVSTSTQILVEETPEEFYDRFESATEEESGDEDDNKLFPDQSQNARTNLQESASSSSQDSMGYPSSLPDTMKEFRDMFGVGDGSYPDDFPMSLRD